MAETDKGTAGRPHKAPGDTQERRPRPPIFAISLLVSLLIHVLLIVMYPLWMVRISPETVPPSPPQLIRPYGTQIVAIIEIPEPEPEAEVETEPESDPETQVVPTQVGEPEPDVEIPDRAADNMTPAERLRPNEENTRLWVPIDRALTDMTAAERLQLEIETEIEAWNDSIGAAVDRAAAVTDWTRTDSEGNRWGVSPGKLHLGKVTLPLPFYFGPANGVQRDELAKRAFELYDIDRAAATGLVRETTRQRAKAMRERADAERADRLATERATEEASSNSEPPDTTRTRR